MPDLDRSDTVAARTQGAAGIRFSNQDYKGDRMAPVVTVPHHTGYCPRWNRSAWFRDEAGTGSPGSSAPRAGADLDLTLAYTCQPWKLAVPLPEEIDSNADVDLRANYRQFAKDKINLGRERRLATLIFTKASWDNGVTLAGTDQWSDVTNSAPLADLRTAIETVADAIGVAPNTVLLGAGAWRSFRWHPDVDAVVGTTLTQRAEVTLGNYLGVDPLVVGSAIYTADEEGAAEADVTYTHIWGKHAWIGYVSRSPSPTGWSPSALYTFRCNGGEIETREFFVKNTATYFIEAREYADELITSSAAGYMIENASA